MIKQLSLFDDESKKKIIDGKKYSTEQVTLNEYDINRLNNYDLDSYTQDVENIGLEETWNKICQYSLDRDIVPSFININNYGELYEIGLAIQDKNLKKKSGQYYTPDDVATVMSKWLIKCDGNAVCDVACGTGKLILTYLDLIGYESARNLIESGNLYLYDFDNVALKICRTAIAIKYGKDIANKINDIFCDFLDSEIKLPENAKVISNPPYAHLDEIQSYWDSTDVLMSTKEFYSAFMEKIINQSKSAVIITPFSFISGNKFYSLRKIMCEKGNGFIISFDNVPGNIFCGRKHGIFNTNTANSVRAAITVYEKSDNKGYRISPLIRFKNEQRDVVLKCEVLEQLLPCELQIVNKSNKYFKKVYKELLPLYNSWVEKSTFTLKDCLSKYENNYLITMPNTCRYYTTASTRKLRRTGLITLYAKDETTFDFIYCLINSSFAYWWWRIYDGGITYPLSLLQQMPIPLQLLTEEDKETLKKLRVKLEKDEHKFIVGKVNAGILQENIKFPESYRNEINYIILKILGFNTNDNMFKKVHANYFMKE